MFQTRITEMFGIRYPIICGGLYWVGRAELIAAVANAGGLGFMAAATFQNLDALRAEIRKARDLTDGPIGLNINLFPALRPQPIEAWVEIAWRRRYQWWRHLVAARRGSSRRYMRAGSDHAQGAGRALRAHCRAARLRRCLRGGIRVRRSPGLDEVTTLVLVPATVDAVSIPVVAGGGFADGRGLVAALALGADAVLMGTRFMATKECRGHPAWKEWLVNATETDTAYVMKSIGNPSRVAKNALADKVMEMEARGTTIEELIPVISGHPNAAFEKGQMEDTFASVGQAVGLIHDVPTVKELFERMVEQAVQVRERLDRAIPAG